MVWIMAAGIMIIMAAGKDNNDGDGGTLYFSLIIFPGVKLSKIKIVLV